MNTSIDVLVVGGGPAGLAVAERVAAAGSVIVAHRDESIGLPVRTSGGSWKKHLDALELPSSLYDEVHELTFAAPGRVITTTFAEDCPVVLHVTAAYRHLAALAQQAGAQVSCGTTFERINRQDDEWVDCVLKRDGVQCDVAARFVVDASGHPRAVLRQLAGGRRRPARFGVGVEYEFRNAGTEPRRAVLFVGSEFAPSGYGWIFPTSIGTVRVGIGIIRPDTESSPSDLLAAFLNSSMAAALGLKIGDLVEKHFGVIPSDGAASAFVHGRVISVGDSAGQALPLVGEGIRYSIEAGRRAGDAIASALRNPDEAASSLMRYEQWWKRTYGRRFSLAQKVNVRMSSFEDGQWKKAAALLSRFSGDEVASLLRMDFQLRLALKLLWERARQRLIR